MRHWRVLTGRGFDNRASSASHAQGLSESGKGFESYEERQLAHAMMRNPRRPLDLDAFSQGMRIQSMHAEKMMDALREKLMRDFATSSGSFVSGRESTPLPWWMAK